MKRTFVTAFIATLGVVTSLALISIVSGGIIFGVYAWTNTNTTKTVVVHTNTTSALQEFQEGYNGR